VRCDIREVGPRDGLQNEAPVPVSERVRLIDALAASGVRRIEAASFVHPSAIPAMAGAEEVLSAIERRPGVSYTALVPNRKGAERALAAGADELEAFVSASTTHNLKNIKRTPTETLDEIAGVVELARAAGRPVDAGVATCFGCPYEGDIEPAVVAGYARRLLDLGADTVFFGDTTGMGSPRRVGLLLDAVEAAGIPLDVVGLHFHDTRGTGLANAYAALQRGVSRFDASIGGLGGFGQHRHGGPRPHGRGSGRLDGDLPRAPHRRRPPRRRGCRAAAPGPGDAGRPPHAAGGLTNRPKHPKASCPMPTSRPIRDM
jgi:hydroxymethylglutaryl-CoA lyase